jgi:hypothetical protein
MTSLRRRSRRFASSKSCGQRTFDLALIEWRRDQSVLEMLLGEDGSPMSERSLTDDDEAAVEALERLDAAGLADRRAGLVVASEPGCF